MLYPVDLLKVVGQMQYCNGKVALFDCQTDSVQIFLPKRFLNSVITTDSFSYHPLFI